MKNSRLHTNQENNFRDFPGGPVIKNPSSNAGDAGLIPGWGTKIPRAAKCGAAGVGGGLMRDKQAAHEPFWGQWKYSVWYNNDGYRFLYVCANSQSEPECKLWTLDDDVSMWVHQL